MQYNTGLEYNNAGISYIGALVIKVPGISNPIILNNIRISFAGLQDYSNLTTVAVLSIDVNPSGVITIETVKENLSALTSVEAITIYDGNVIGLG
jgi:hypothetical protein